MAQLTRANVRPRVSIVVPNFNGKYLLKECLDSVKNLHYDKYEVIVVDNSSTDGSAEMVREQYPWATLLVTERIKMAQACNRGMAIAKGKIIVTMLNNDMMVDKYWLDHLVTALRKREVGIVGGKIYEYGTNLMYAAGGMINWSIGSAAQIGRGESDKGQHDALREVDYVDVPTVRRDVMNVIGGMDEEYDFYYVDPDYCVRAKKAGYKVVYVPDAISWHRSSSTVGPRSLRQYFSMQKDGLRFLMKHSSPRLILIRFYRRMFFALVASFSNRFEGKRADMVRLAIAAVLWNLVKLRKTMRSRRKLWLWPQTCVTLI